MRTSKLIAPCLVTLALAACATTAQPAQGPAATITVAPTTPPPAPPAPPPPAQHVEAHLNRGHITLEHQIQFDTDSDHIQEQQSQSVLADLVALLRENPQVRRLRVEGHTDTRGSAEHNMDLSRRRAQAVADYLRGHGFQNVEFEAQGLGQNQPLCREDATACHDRNRRVEFTITDPPAAQ